MHQSLWENDDHVKVHQYLDGMSNFHHQSRNELVDQRFKPHRLSQRSACQGGLCRKSRPCANPHQGTLRMCFHWHNSLLTLPFNKEGSMENKEQTKCLKSLEKSQMWSSRVTPRWMTGGKFIRKVIHDMDRWPTAWVPGESSGHSTRDNNMVGALELTKPTRQVECLFL